MSGQTEQQMKFGDKLRIMHTGKIVFTYMKYAYKRSLPFPTAKKHHQALTEGCSEC